MKSINPFNGNLINSYEEHSSDALQGILDNVQQEYVHWKQTSYGERSALMARAASVLRNRKEEFARLMTLEMGKLLRESMAEVEKCAWVCEYYSQHAEVLLKPEVVETDARRSYVTFQPLGIVLAVMPWNFPFWQVFRFAAPALMAGNAAVLKHASNVPGCALAIESVFREAGFPANLFRTLMIPASAVQEVIAHRYVKAVTLTGSESAGSSVASFAGKMIKKSLLELGGSDAFIVLDDADLEQTIKTAVTARMLNQGQSCIAAKRFIVTGGIAEAFTEGMKVAFEKLKMGDPLESDTQVGPLARPDLVDDIEDQVKRSVEAGAVVVAGGKRIPGPGCFFEPTILTGVKPGMAVYSEETFGPVVTIITVQSEDEAINVANDSDFGLGGCVWTQDVEKGERVALQVETGAMFVNGMTKSDPRLPFGGINRSGYGRELGTYGIKEFVNIKTIWVG